MKVALGLLLLMLGLCGLSQATNQTDPDILAEVKELRDMVVELQGENTGMQRLLFLYIDDNAGLSSKIEFVKVCYLCFSCTLGIKLFSC